MGGPLSGTAMVWGVSRRTPVDVEAPWEPNRARLRCVYRLTVDHFSALARSDHELQRRLVTVTAEQRARPSNCPGWSVHELINHVIGGGHRYLLLLQGAEPAQLVATRTQDHVGADPAVVHRTWAESLTAAFYEPGALTRVVHHPAGDRSGLDLLRMRVLDQTLHGWDLAVSLETADDMDEELAGYLLDEGTDLIEELRAEGLYAVPPGDAPPTEDRATQLLTLAGRRRGHRP